MLAILLVCELDRRGSRRSVLDQYCNHRYTMAAVNLAVLAATPRAVRAQPFVPITKTTFPNVGMLRRAYAMLRAEALEALPSSKPIANDQFFTRIADKGWRRFYLKWYTKSCDPLALRLCPQTCALLQRMPNVKLAMFSILEPGSRILPHSGLFRGCYRYHMGIETPQDDACFISLGGETYSWRDGQDVLFDDTFEHYVVNNTDKRRIVLFLDVERPLESPVARALNAAFIKYVAPLSTRANDKQEARSLQRRQ
jgi:beta-hydroxylase